MNIYLKIEILNRELESRLLLSLFAYQNNHNVIIANESFFRKAAKLNLIKPGIIIDKSILPKPSKINEINFFKSKGFMFYSIDEEAGITYEKYDYFGNIRYGEKTLSICDGVFTWGEFDYNFLKKKFTNLKSKIYNTGNPRVDMWKKQFDNYFYNKNLFAQEYIFIPSSFGSFLSEKRFWDRIETRRKNLHFENGVDEFKLYNVESNSLILTKEFIKMIRLLLKNFKNINIILRPHSYENNQAWKKLIGEYNNLKIINDDGITKWIRNAKLIIHNGCTSGMEASFSNKNVVAYVPFKNDLIREVPNNCSKIVNNFESLKEIVNNIYYKNINLDQNGVNILENRFKNFGNELAVENILRVIEQNKENKNLCNKNNLFFIKLFSIFQDCKLNLINLLSFNKVNINLSKFKKFEKNNIRKILDGYKKIFNYSKKINVKYISSRVIYFKAK